MNPQGLPSMLASSMGQGIPAPQQVTQSSPNFQPNMGAQPTIAMPDKSPATMMHLHGALQRRGINPATIPQANQMPQQGQATLPIQDQNPQQPGIQVPTSEAELILKALTGRLQLLGKHETAVRDAILPKKEEAKPNE